MTKSKRLEKIEEMVTVKNYGLRAVMSIDAFYTDDSPEDHLYWTDEPIVNSLDDFYSGEWYRKVQHPDGVKPTMKDM